MATRLVRSADLQLWSEDFGDPADSPVLLVMGMCAQGITWPDAFVQQLVDNGRYVIRYDHRDTGQSDTVDFAARPYTLGDLTRDAAAVLDAHELDSAHIVGASMGGMIGQLLALRHHERVRTLTTIMSTPVAGDRSQLPPPSQEFLRTTAEAAKAPPTNRAERIEHGLRISRVLAGSLPFDEDEVRRNTERALDRSRRPGSEHNHQQAINSTGPAEDQTLAAITTPTLVIHGTEDPLLPLAHGEVLAERITDSQLIRVEGMGHSLPAPVQDRIAKATLDHTS